MDTDKMLKRLEVLSDRRRHLEDEIDGLVALLRADMLDEGEGGTRTVWEVSWSDIGDALGISRQAAQQLYSRRWAR